MIKGTYVITMFGGEVCISVLLDLEKKQAFLALGNSNPNLIPLQDVQIDAGDDDNGAPYFIYTNEQGKECILNTEFQELEIEPVDPETFGH